jgi:hypothetical protein
MMPNTPRFWPEIKTRHGLAVLWPRSASRLTMHERAMLQLPERSASGALPWLLQRLSAAATARVSGKLPGNATLHSIFDGLRKHLWGLTEPCGLSGDGVA